MISLLHQSPRRGFEIALLVAGATFLFVLPVPHTATVRQVCLFVAVAISIVLIRRDGMPTLPLKTPFAVWSAVAGFSLVYAVNPKYSLGEIKTELLYSWLVFFVFFTQTRSARDWNVWIGAVAVSLLVLSLTNVWLWHSIANAISARYFYNGVGAYTTYLITVLPFVIFFLFKMPMRGAGRALLRGSPLLLLVPAYVTMNRTVWVVVAVLMLTLVSLLIFSSRSRTPKRAVITALGLFFLASMFFFYTSLERRVMHPEALIDTTLATDPRPTLWRFVVAEIWARPAQGIGFGQHSFAYAYPQWQEKNSLLSHTHNVFLDAGIQMGVPGIAAMLFMFGAVLLEYWRLYRSNHRLAQWLGACGIAMVAAVLVRNMTDDFFRRDLALLFWSLVGASLGYGHRLLAAELRTDVTAKRVALSPSRASE